MQNRKRTHTEMFAQAWHGWKHLSTGPDGADPWEVGIAGFSVAPGEKSAIGGLGLAGLVFKQVQLAGLGWHVDGTRQR